MTLSSTSAALTDLQDGNDPTSSVSEYAGGEPRGTHGTSRNSRAQFLVIRARADQEADIFSGVREDLLVRNGAALRVRERRILLDQTVLKSFNLSILF